MQRTDLAAAAARLADAGLNAWGVAPGDAYDHLLPGCRSVMVFASGGGRLWEAFLDDVRAHPGHLSDEQNPLDAFVRRSIEAADPGAAAAGRRWVRCAGDAEVFVDFRPLALAAGLGQHSRLGLLLHPTYGPWMGLRAACFTTEELEPTGPLAAPGPCEGCDAPCAVACAGGAISPSEGIDIRRCSGFHVETGEEGPCARACHARAACPEGAGHRYSELEIGYHYDRRGGRRRVAAALGVEVGFEGSGPYWGSWE